MIVLLSALAFAILAFKEPPHELTLREVVKANKGSINAIHSFHVTIERADNLPVGSEPPPLQVQPSYTIDLYRDGARQRVRIIWLRGPHPNSIDDEYNGPEGFKALRNHDPDFKPVLSESIDGPARGELDNTRIMEEAFTYDARDLCYMGFLKNHRFVTLEEYVAAYPRSTLVATPTSSKLGYYEILTLEEVNTPTDKDIRDLRVFVDPKVGFWIRRIERGPLKKSTSPGDKHTTITEVQEFKDCGQGIFWPMRATSITRLTGATAGVDSHVRYNLHLINQTVPQEDFEIHFPDWIRIYDRPARKVMIWGPENKARMTFTPAEYEEWYMPRRPDPNQGAISMALRKHRLILLVGIPIIVGLLLFLIFRQRNQKAGFPKNRSVSPV